MDKVFKNAQEAFESLYDEIDSKGFQNGNGTKKLTNIGFKILNPLDNKINTPFRKWSLTYALREFEWYMSANRSIEEIKKFAPIWDKMHGGNNIVNSNYGYQWKRNEQLRKAIDKLPEGYKSVLVLYYFGNLSHSEVASVLGIDPGTSRSQISKAKSALKK